MRLRVRNLIIALTAVACLAAAAAGPAAAAASPPGTASLFAGGGKFVISTAGTPASDAAFNNVSTLDGVAVDSAGDVAIADTLRNVIDLMPGANCTTDCPFGLSNMVHGDLYAIVGYGSTAPTTSGVPIAKASLGTGCCGAGAHGLAFDAAGDLLIVDSAQSQVYLVSARDCSQSCPYGLSSMRTGYVYLIAGADGTGQSLGTAPAWFNNISATKVNLVDPRAVTVDSGQDIVFSDTGTNEVYLVAASACSSNCPLGISSMVAGDIYTVAGNGTFPAGGTTVTLATQSALDVPNGVAFDAHGNLFIAGNGGKVEFVPSQSCSSNCDYGYPSFVKNDLNLFDTLTEPEGVLVDPVGDVLISDAAFGDVQIYSAVNCSTDCPYGLTSMQAGTFYDINTTIPSPMHMALSPSGTLYVANSPFLSGTAGFYQITGGATPLTVSVTGTGTLSGGGTTCHTSCTAVHAAGTQIKLTATPGTGNLFAGWKKGAGCKGVGTCEATVASGTTPTAVFRTRKYLAEQLRFVLNRIRGNKMAPKQIWRHKGFNVTFNAAAARKVVIAWRIRRHHHSVLVAIGHRVPMYVGVHTHLKIELTKAGRRLLSASTAFKGTETAHLYLGKNHKAITLKRRIKV